MPEILPVEFKLTLNRLVQTSPGATTSRRERGTSRYRRIATMLRSTLAFSATLALVFPGRNQDSNDVLFTILVADGSFKAVTRLAKLASR
jgi:hypothetical protein